MKTLIWNFAFKYRVFCHLNDCYMFRRTEDMTFYIWRWWLKNKIWPHSPVRMQIWYNKPAIHHTVSEVVFFQCRNIFASIRATFFSKSLKSFQKLHLMGDDRNELLQGSLSKGKKGFPINSIICWEISLIKKTLCGMLIMLKAVVYFWFGYREWLTDLFLI